MWGISLDSPIWLLLGCIISVWYIYRFWFSKDTGRKSFFLPEKITTSSWRGWIQGTCTVSSILLFAILLSYPTKAQLGTISSEGSDIVFVLDVSKSMLADDFSPDRLSVAKQVMIQFLDQLSTDRVGLVVFAGKPFSSIPLTLDYEFLQQKLSTITTETINQSVKALQGTATGEGLMAALRMLDIANDDNKKSEHAVILLTDGAVTPNTLDPLLVAQLASEKSIALYTVGIGSVEGGSISVERFGELQNLKVEGVDEELLKKIAKITDANYRRATDEQTFSKIFEEIRLLSTSSRESEKMLIGEPYRQPFAKVLLTILIILTLLELFIPIDYAFDPYDSYE